MLPMARGVTPYESYWAVGRLTILSLNLRPADDDRQHPGTGYRSLGPLGKPLACPFPWLCLFALDVVAHGTRRSRTGLGVSHTRTNARCQWWRPFDRV